MHDDIENLLTQVRRGPATPRERSLALAIERLKVEHKFAFESWQQSVKRQGRLSAELAQATVVELRVEDARTVARPRSEHPLRGDRQDALLQALGRCARRQDREGFVRSLPDTKIGLIRELRAVEQEISDGRTSAFVNNLCAYRTALRDELHRRNYRP